MTIRNLDALFDPQAIALIGASNQPGSVGAVLARNLFDAGFKGAIMPVNPHEKAIRSTVNYRSVAELPVAPDLAVIATPPPTVPGLIADLGARGCRAAVVITAGFGEAEKKEKTPLRQRMLEAARPHLLRIVGPNCIGFISPHRGINASFAHLSPPAGDLAFVTQSGALAVAVLDWAVHRGIGFSHVVSVGDMSDVDFGDLLDYLALDANTRAILLYVEAATNVRKFMSAGRIAARAKPVVVIKSGRSSAGAKAALSHTGALAGSDAVYDAAFRRAGMLRVRTLRELFEAAGTLATPVRPRGDRLAILTNGGGAGVLATDSLGDHGAEPAPLSPQTVAALNAILPASWSHANPVDILGDAPPDLYRKALDALMEDPSHDAFLVLNCPTALVDSIEAARAVVETAKRRPSRPVLTCWLGEDAAEPSRRLFAAQEIPTYETPDEAVRAFMHLVDHERNHALLMETPPVIADDSRPDVAAARTIIARVLAENRSVLTEPEAKALLAAYRIPVLATATAGTPEEAARIAREIGCPVALKILSPDISHKSDVGGVVLDLPTPDAVADAARRMAETVRGHRPAARLAGFTGQKMADRSRAHELIVGIVDDALFGPVLLVGQGGTAVEVIADRAIGLPPLNLVLAKEMIGRTRISRLLRGYRDRPAADVDAVATTLVRLSGMAADLGELVELDITPLLTDERGVIALDARIVVRPAAGDPAGRLAIRPYPSHLEQEIALADGERLMLRPIRPEDEPALRTMLETSSAEDIRLRFFASLKSLGRGFAARLTQIDYDREMALVATAASGADAGRAIVGAVRIVADPDNVAAEFGIMVRSDHQGRGLGYALMQRIIAYGWARGLERIFGYVLRENRAMLLIAKELGFTRTRSAEDPAVVCVTLELGKSRDG